MFLREGTLQEVILKDLTNDNKPEIIIVTASVGTGGYKDLHIFSFNGKKVNTLPL